MRKLCNISMLSVLVVFVLLGNFNKVEAEDLFDLAAESAILIDGDTGKILYQKNPDVSLPPASMTKMMTEYLILEAVNEKKISWVQELMISEYTYKVSQNRDLSNVPLRIDHKYNIKELYEAMAIYSANGATIALAEVVAGTESNFVKLMNDKAKELGLKDYKFVNSSGLNNKDLFGMHPSGTDTEENMMSARDTAKLAFHLINDYPEVLDTSSITKKTFREGTDDAINMSNWNWMLPGLVFEYEGMDGLKTGSTELAGYSFTATAERKGIRLLSVVMKTNSYKERFQETRKLLDYGFSNFSKKQLYPAGFHLKSKPVVSVSKGKEKEVGIATNGPIEVLVKSGQEKSYKVRFLLDKSFFTKKEELIAPLKKKQKIGKVQLVYSGDDNYGYIAEGGDMMVDVITTAGVEKTNGFMLILRGIGSYISDIWKTTVDGIS